MALLSRYNFAGGRQEEVRPRGGGKGEAGGGPKVHGQGGGARHAPQGQQKQECQVAKMR